MALNIKYSTFILYNFLARGPVFLRKVNSKTSLTVPSKRLKYLRFMPIHNCSSPFGVLNVQDSQTCTFQEFLFNVEINDAYC